MHQKPHHIYFELGLMNGQYFSNFGTTERSIISQPSLLETFTEPMAVSAASEEFRACLADIADPSEVRRRIECLVKRFLTNLMKEQLTVDPLSLICRTANNTGADGEGIYLSDATFQRYFTNKNSAKSFFRGAVYPDKSSIEDTNKPVSTVWKIMETCYELLGLGKQATQRELYYKHLSTSGSYIESQEQVNDAIQDAVAVLLCDRRSLGILGSSKGAVVGRLFIEEPGEEIVDCSCLGSSAHAISGDMILQQRLQSDARYILVIEKDAIFQRLVEERFFQSVPSIIITARGYPDLASRAFLHRLHKQFPKLPIVALVDWNPAGLAIICTYKFGSIRMGLEAPRYVCDVKWLGLRNQDIQTYVSDDALLPLTKRDKSLAKGLLGSKMLQNQDLYKRELHEMLAFGQRAEIEALYAHGFDFLGKFIRQKIVQRDYI